MSLELSEIGIRGGALVLASAEQIDDLERELGVRFPVGYREYVTTLGEGILSDYVRVLPPWQVRAQVDEHRARMAGYWFWDEAPEGVDQDWGMESVPIADTLDGDALAFHPSDPQRVVVLPRNLDQAFARDKGLLEAVEWVCSGGVLGDLGRERSFEPFDSRDEVAERAVDPAASSPDVESAPAGLTPEMHLRLYADALREVEEAALTAQGGPSSVRRRSPPDLPGDPGEWFRRFAKVHARYCTPALAETESVGFGISHPVQHDPAVFRIGAVSMDRKGRAVIRVSEGTLIAELRDYILEPQDGGWRISSIRQRGFDESWKPPKSLKG